MNITAKTAVAALVVALGVLVVWTKLTSPQVSSIPSSSLSPVYETREQDGGNVTVSVKPTMLQPKQQPQFQISLETHTVDLDFDITQIASLVDDQNNSFGQSIWDGSAPGGHHRKGTLTFDTPLPAEADAVTLTLKDIAGIPKRNFQWSIIKKTDTLK